MSILKYIGNLLPTFKRDKITEVCETTSASIREHTLPAYRNAEELFKGKKFKSEQARYYASGLEKKIGKMPGNTIVGSIRVALENSLILLQTISSDSKNIYSETEANISLTYVKATYLRLVEAASFSNDYARKFLNYLFILETAEADENVSLKDSLSPAEIAWLDSSFQDFVLAVEILSKDVKETQRLIKGVPDALITSLTEKTFPATIGVAKIDPFRMNQFSASVNPFYFFGMMVAEVQANSYKSAKIESELLELRLLNLQKIYANTQDASLQKEIEVMEGRVKMMNYKVNEMKKDWLNG